MQIFTLLVGVTFIVLNRKHALKLDLWFRQTPHVHWLSVAITRFSPASDDGGSGRLICIHVVSHLILIPPASLILAQYFFTALYYAIVIALLLLLPPLQQPAASTLIMVFVSLLSRIFFLSPSLVRKSSIPSSAGGQRNICNVCSIFSPDVFYVTARRDLYIFGGEAAAHVPGYSNRTR